MPTSFIVPFNLARLAKNHSVMRRWSQGRWVVEAECRDENEWLRQSELSIAGRPLKACNEQSAR